MVAQGSGDNMKIHDDLYLYGVEYVIETLKRALTFVFIEDVLEPNVELNLNEFVVTYTAYGSCVCVRFSKMELEGLKISLEQFSLEVKQRAIYGFRSEIDKKERGMYDGL